MSLRVKTSRGWDRHKGTPSAWISFLGPNRHLLLGFWPRRWRFDAVIPVPAKPPYRRVYVGPFEVEWSVSPDKPIRRSADVVMKQGQ